MPRLSAVDAITPATERTKSMLFRPFRFNTWLKIGFIGWLGGAGTFGGFNFRSAVPGGAGGGGSAGQDIEQAVRTFVHEHLLLLALGVVFVIAVFLVLFYLSCRFRFILFDSVLSHDPQITRGWKLYGDQGNRYFAFMLCFTILSVFAIALVVGLPLRRAFKTGVFTADDPLPALLHLFVPMILGIIFLVMLGLTVAMLANDFLLPLMAIDNLSIGRGWARIKEMSFAEPGAFIAYLALKPVLAIAAGIAVSLAMIVALVVLAIPGVIIALVIVAMIKSAGTAGMVVGIILAALGILVGLALIVMLTLLTTAPLAVFFTSYSLYFFGGRYPRLGELLWPQPQGPLPPPPISAPPPFPGAAPA